MMKNTINYARLALLSVVLSVHSLHAQAINLVLGRDMSLDPAWQEISVGEGRTVPAFTMRNTLKEVKIEIPAEKQDWSRATVVMLRIYRPSAEAAKIIIAVDPQPEADGTIKGYWWFRLSADWEGWKEVEIPWSQFKFSKQENDDSLTRVATVRFINQWGDKSAASWGIPTASPGVWGVALIGVR